MSPAVPSKAQPPVDRLGRAIDDLRISVIDRCNFRCSFCMPAGHDYSFLPREELLSFEETARLARVFVALGVSKIRLTGGEPLLRRELEKLVALLAAIPGLRDLALTTNGVLLSEKAKVLSEAGLSRVTVSLPSLDDRIFREMTGQTFGVQHVVDGIDAAIAAGMGPIKVNAVILRGVNDEGLVELARFFKERRIEGRFIEYMDVGTVNGWKAGEVLSAREILGRIDAVLPMEEVGREQPSDVALRFRYRDDGVHVGAIASITEPFCGDCSRARLSADGKLYTCLFAASGHDLKEIVRSGVTMDEIAAAVARVWRGRTDRYSEERKETSIAPGSSLPSRKIEMFRIGG